MTMSTSKPIGMLHYAGPPVIGGVESTIYHHARGLSNCGYAVRVVSGRGSDFDPRVETIIDPLFGSTHEAVLRAKKALDGGTVPDDFDTLVAQMLDALHQAFDSCAAVIVHNALTMNKNLPLTAALHAFNQQQPARLIAWCHDLAWTNTQYLPELHEAEPWRLLKQRWPGVRYVTVSEPRRHELAGLLGMDADEVAVVVPGVDPAGFYRWTPTTAMLAERLSLLDADGILLVPARLTRRKNIALGLRVLASLRAQSGRDYRLVITGPPGPHNPANPGYLGELLDERAALKLDDHAHFLYAYGDSSTPLIPDDATMANLYAIADTLLFPSLQEGFGIPMLEAGFAGLPVFCSDIPPFRSTGQDDAYYFDPVNDAPDQIAARILRVLDASPAHRLRVRARRHYRWDSLIRKQIIPLIEEGNRDDS